MNTSRSLFLLSTIAAAALLASNAQAQQAASKPEAPKAGTPAAQKKDEAAPEAEVQRVIMTGTSVLRAGFETPLSVTALGQKDLGRLTFSSQADILATLPGIKAEGGGGEVAANVQVRGLPSSGQYQFTPLQYDGLPAFSTFGLNSSAYDVYIRNDLGVQRLEFVQGGVSNLFGQGSVAGIINYISRTGGKEHQGTFQTEVADKGRLKQDIFLSGPMGERTYYAVSGFYRYDEGPLKGGLPAQGGQLRGNIKHDIAGGGTLKVFGQLIDDSVQFFLPVPLNGSTLGRVAGADGNTVYTVNTTQAAGLVSVLPNGGRYVSPIAEGVKTKGGSLGMTFDRDLGNDYALNMKAKFSSYQHQFNLFLDGDGVINVPETQAQFLANRGIAGPAAFTYVDSGQAVAAGTLLFPNRLLNRNRPASDFSSEINLTKRIEQAGTTHNITLGSWMARSTADDNSITQAYLADFRNQPRLVNLSAGGINYTRNGLWDPSVGYTQNTHSATRVAVYLADQMESGKWAFDIGARVERLNGDVRREVATTVNGIGQGGANESAALTSVLHGSGRYLTGSVSTTETAFSGGALYKLSRQMNWYANASRGFFFPELRSVSFNALGAPQSYTGEIIDQYETGLKYGAGPLTATVAAFYSKLANRRSVTFQNLAGGGIGEVVTLLSTETTGVEAAASYRLSRAWTLSGNVTVSEHEITEGAFKGKELERKPKLFSNAALVYDDGAWDANVGWNYQSRAFTNNANSAVLPAYHLWRAAVGYRMAMANKQSLRFGLSVFNLTNSEGLAEGSPRLGANQQAGGAYFVGRPILPRRVSATVTYSF